MFVNNSLSPWRQFKSDCHQTSSVISLATGDEVIQGQRPVGEVCALLNALLVKQNVLSFNFFFFNDAHDDLITLST